MFAALAAAAVVLPALALASPALVRRTVSALAAPQITAFTPYTFFAAAGYCAANTTATWTCGGASLVAMTVPVRSHAAQ